MLAGEIMGSETTQTVEIYGTPAGSATEALLATVSAEYDPKTMSSMCFSEVGPLYANTLLRAHVAAARMVDGLRPARHGRSKSGRRWA